MRILPYDPRREYYFTIGHHYNYDKCIFEDTKFVMRRWGNVIIEAQPRYGKSALSKDLVVKISKIRRLVIFDYGGEWEHDITRYNAHAEYPDRLVGHKILKNFTFNILTFNKKEDFASMGFDGLWASIVCDIIRETEKIHEGDIEQISEILSNIPVKNTMYRGFNAKYGTTLAGPINASIKTSITTRWGIIRNFFWQGVGDKRVIYDFKEELLHNTHLLINLSGNSDGFDEWMKRAYTGKILEQMFPAFAEAKPVFVCEESRMIFPNWQGDVALSSNVQIYNVVTHAPKLGVMIIFIAQHENQIYQPILENIHTRIIGRVQKAPPWIARIFKRTRLVYDPEHNIREFLYMDVTSDTSNPTYIRFRPVEPCVYYKSDR
jgi:hypothetical protein